MCPPLPLPSPLITDSILFDCCVVAIVDVGIGIVIVVVVSPLLALLFIVAPDLAIIAAAAAILPEANNASAIANKKWLIVDYD